MNKKIVIALVVIAIIAIGGWFLPQAGKILGNSTASFWNANGGFRVSGTEVISSARALTNIVGLTTTSGDLTLTTSNTATSTAIVGCIQTYATSTATAISLTYNAVATSTTNMTNGQASDGFVQWQYGGCPF